MLQVRLEVSWKTFALAYCEHPASDLLYFCCTLAGSGGPWCAISRTPHFELAFNLVTATK